MSLSRAGGSRKRPLSGETTPIEVVTIERRIHESYQVLMENNAKPILTTQIYLPIYENLRRFALYCQLSMETDDIPFPIPGNDNFDEIKRQRYSC